MNNLKKVGLTALAASLVSVSASAGEMSVSGAAKVNYTSGAGDTGGNPFSSSETLTFSGGGDLDNGMTVDVSYSMLDGAATTASSVALGMGDGGTLTFGVGISGGVRSFDGKVPSAGEEVWDDMAGDGNDISGQSGDNSFVYTGSFGGFDVSAQYTKNGSSADGGENQSDGSIGVSYAVGDTGLTVGYAAGEDGATADEDVAYATYVIGGATLGISKFDREVGSSTADRDTTWYGASFAVNENLSVSAGKAVTNFGDKTVDQESSGVAASYTMGSITVATSMNKQDGVGGATGTEDDHTEVSVTFAF
jgi:outer membrane protein OmpU